MRTGRLQHSGEIAAIIKRLEERADSVVDVTARSSGVAARVGGATDAVRGTIATIAASVSQMRDMNIQIASAAGEQSAVAGSISRNVADSQRNMQLSGQLSAMVRSVDHVLRQFEQGAATH